MTWDHTLFFSVLYSCYKGHNSCFLLSFAIFVEIMILLILHGFSIQYPINKIVNGKNNLFVCKVKKKARQDNSEIYQKN